MKINWGKMGSSQKDLQGQLIALGFACMICFIAIAIILATQLGNGNAFATTYVAEVATVVSTNLDPNTFVTGNPQVANQSPVQGFGCANNGRPLTIISPCVSTFLNVTSDGVVQLLRGGYYTAYVYFLIDPSIATTGQWCSFKANDPTTVGFYGPSTPGGILLFVNSLTPVSETYSFPFFYNGSVPVTLPLAVNCNVLTPVTVFSTVTIIITYERNPNIVGISQ